MGKIKVIAGRLIITSCILITILVAFMLIDQKFNTQDLSKVSEYERVRAETFTTSMKMIWPISLSSEIVKEFRLISYYDDVDAYTGYLRIEFNDRSIDSERERLKSVGADDYKGKYNNSGFSAYEVLAIKTNETKGGKTDGYNGFTYALDAGNNEIIYVELEFPRDTPRNDYIKIIPDKYLPDGLEFY